MADILVSYFLLGDHHPRWWIAFACKSKRLCTFKWHLHHQAYVWLHVPDRASVRVRVPIRVCPHVPMTPCWPTDCARARVSLTESAHDSAILLQGLSYSSCYMASIFSRATVLGHSSYYSSQSFLMLQSLAIFDCCSAQSFLVSTIFSHSLLIHCSVISHWYNAQSFLCYSAQPFIVL
jgi:hypothetical protein